MTSRSVPSSFTGRIRPGWIATGLFLLALLPRLLTSAPFTGWDEIFWTHGGVAFWTALLQGRLADTFIIGQPGVPVLWIGGLASLAGSLLEPGGLERFISLGAGPAYHSFDADLLRQAAPFLIPARSGMALLTAAGVAGVYLLSRRVLGERIALVGTLLLAFDPFLLAHSRAAALDAALALATLLAFLALWAYTCSGRRRDLVLAGALAGGAVATKLPALYLAPVAMVVLAAAAWQRPEEPPARRLAIWMGNGLLWGGVALACFWALWPAMWVQPFDTVARMAATLGEYNAQPDSANFFLGQAVGDPGWGYYPVVLAFELTLLGSVGSLSWLVALGWKPARRLEGVVLLVYALGYIAFLSISPSKYARYALPAAVALNLVAAMGLAGWLEGVSRTTAQRQAACAFLALALVGQGAWTLAAHPNYLAVYNPLLGGTPAAARTISVGWGEGMDQVVDWLNDQPGAANLKVALWPMVGTAPGFVGETYLLDHHGLAVADYVVVYLGDAQYQSPRVDRFYGRAEPLFTAHLRGVEYAWVYRNDTYQDELAYIQAHAGPDDLVLLDVDGQLARHYPGPQPVLVLAGALDAGEQAARLNEMAAGRPRIWYLRYKNVRSETRPALTELLIAYAEHIQDVPVGDDKIVVFRPPEEPVFGVR
ncbi:MAG: glycosyltransferase family 39 protein [Anaerolineae bacterium]|nr:glycosyltransferase family 39 protein [Anaerolineae bacterium]